jgi:hypothetical protein
MSKRTRRFLLALAVNTAAVVSYGFPGAASAAPLTCPREAEGCMYGYAQCPFPGDIYFCREIAGSGCGRDPDFVQCWGTSEPNSWACGGDGAFVQCQWYGG